jgi:hypothetical protein
MVQFLQALGMSIEIHRDHFPQDEDDHLWIPVCAEKGWAIISGDKGIEKAALNAQAVIDSHAKVFILTDANMKGIEWAAAIIAGRHRMQKIIDENDGPFYVTVGKSYESHVGRLRFVGSGGPKIREPELETDSAKTKAIETAGAQTQAAAEINPRLKFE